MLKDYVVGFAFDLERRRVILIQKTKPDWQKGKLNGVGGKIEPGEYPQDAMAREFHEETGVGTAPADWRHFATVLTPVSRVYMFTTTLGYNAFNSCRTVTDEQVCPTWVERMAWWAGEGTSFGGYVPNLRWLIPLATRWDDLAVPVVAHNLREDGR